MKTEELTLDPADWDEFRNLAHQMTDDILNYLSTLRSRPAWQPMPEEVRARLQNEPVPFTGQGEDEAYQAFAKDVLPYPNGNIHPRFFGWVQGNGTPLGMMADMLGAAINPHMAGFNQAPALVEAQVIRWFIKLMGYPDSASGVLALGGSMANMLGLAIARNTRAGFDVRTEGALQNNTRLMVYASMETHRWIVKGVEFLGLGRNSLSQIPVDHNFQINIKLLREAIRQDRQKGFRPICVVGNAGTVNTAATDNLRELASLCHEEGLWFHVDGSFGALACLSDRLRPIVAGIEEADSMAFDFHKWMYQPFDVACLLVRDRRVHEASFSNPASYLASMSRGVIAGGLPYAELSMDLTRSFRALKVWMSMKAYGVYKFAKLIEQNVDQAQRMAQCVRSHTELELLAPVPLNIVCFRFAPQGVEENQLNSLNEEILLQLQESGIAVPSSTVVNGRFSIRCAIVNHRSRWEDFETLMAAVVRIGHECLAQASRTAVGGMR
ncbi:MAG TPA: pyridoxal-dependent decarboxylase [Candidatus Angelobacter sp.]|nr:pyridoxal-dependent decarboxylase [Candidatus Angelobacter sp.]